MRNWFIFGLVSAGEIKVSIFWELPQNVLMLFSLLTIAHHGGMIRGKSESFFIFKTKREMENENWEFFIQGDPQLMRLSRRLNRTYSISCSRFIVASYSCKLHSLVPYLQVLVLDLSEVSSFVGNSVLSTLLILWIHVHYKERLIKGF